LGIAFLEPFMPIYEFTCLACRDRFSVRLTYDEYGKTAVTCPICHEENVKRRIGRVRVGHTEEERLQQIADPAQMDALDQDPAALGGMLRKMKDQMGEEIAPEFDEVVGRLEKGQTPEQIEKEIPDFGGANSEPIDSGYSEDF
jgi:putative FmdB family regulatory protein